MFQGLLFSIVGTIISLLLSGKLKVCVNLDCLLHNIRNNKTTMNIGPIFPLLKDRNLPQKWCMHTDSTGSLGPNVLQLTLPTPWTYPGLGLCQRASGCSLRSTSEPNVDFTRWLFSSLWASSPWISSSLLTEAESTWEEGLSLMELNSSVRYLEYTWLFRKLGKNTWNIMTI